jgi:hypothetical protein
MSYRAGVVALLAIATLIATQPLGVFWHFVHDHLGEYSHAAHDSAALHLGDADAADHDADHHHIWMTPAATVEPPQISQPRMTTAISVFEDASWPSATPFPPFSPPRA